MSVYVYAIRFEDGGTYVGMTNDISRRLGEHQRKQSPSLRRFQGEFQLFYQKEFQSYAEARSHEKFLKSGAGKKLLAGIRT